MAQQEITSKEQSLATAAKKYLNFFHGITITTLAFPLQKDAAKALSKRLHKINVIGNRMVRFVTLLRIVPTTAAGD